MASASGIGRRSLHRRRSRHSRTVDALLDVDEADTQPATCIDLTLDVSVDDVIDLTHNQSISLIDSPVVVLSSVDGGRTRRGSGRRGRRRTSSRRGISDRTANRSLSVGSTSLVHVLSDDSDSDDLPSLPFEVSPANSAINDSLIRSPEAVHIFCPVCLDDTKKIQHSGRQVMSTNCGHIFCDTCIKSVISTRNNCPTCRKKISLRSIHPLFI